MFWTIVILLVFLGPIASLLSLKWWTSLGVHLKEPHNFWRSSWILLAAEVILIGLTLLLGYRSLFVVGNENVVLHVVGGGVVTSVIFTYFLENLTVRLGLIDKLILLFFVACGLGVTVEMIEWGLDFVTHSRYSVDRLDTWRDLGSDLVGAYGGLLVIEAGRKAFCLVTQRRG